MADFDRASSKYLPTVLRWMSNSLPIRWLEQPLTRSRAEPPP
jgi:hypothetical protein